MRVTETTLSSRLFWRLSMRGVSGRILLLFSVIAFGFAGLLAYEAVTPSVCYQKDPAEILSLGACMLLLAGIWGWSGLRVPNQLISKRASVPQSRRQRRADRAA